MERNIQRIDGEKYDLARFTDDELNNVRGHIIARVSGMIADIETIEAEIARRRPEEQLTIQYTDGLLAES